MFRAIDTWLIPYLRRQRHTLPTGGIIDLIICVCDHFEPHHDAGSVHEVQSRMSEWLHHFPSLTNAYHDTAGRSPAHTFFVPIEQYDPCVCNTLSTICESSHAEVEVHLHHDADSPDSLRDKLAAGVLALAEHGFLSRDRTGKLRFGFVHGDWALDNSHPTGRHCGVNNELEVLVAAGCYADFTLPAAPDPCQTRTINSIYWACDGPEPKSHDRGDPVMAGEANSPAQLDDSRLLMIQGPLGLDWSRRKWGFLPRMENGELSGANPPRPGRLQNWLRYHIHVRGRPEWAFVKLHTHGGIPPNYRMLLGDPMRAFYVYLSRMMENDKMIRVHYVTARELVNIVLAAAAGHAGSPSDYRDFVFAPPPCVLH